MLETEFYSIAEFKVIQICVCLSLFSIWYWLINTSLHESKFYVYVRTDSQLLPVLISETSENSHLIYHYIFNFLTVWFTFSELNLHFEN